MTIILAIDPSTDVTGIAVVGFGPKGEMSLLAADAFDATDYYRILCKGRTAMFGRGKTRKDSADEARLYRIRYARCGIAGFLTRLETAFDIAAYEMPNANHSPVKAGNQAIGAYLSLSSFADVPLMPVNATTMKACTIGRQGLIRAKGKTGADLNEKGRMVTWANETLGLSLSGPKGEAVADSIACAFAAYRASINPVQKSKAKQKAVPSA